MNLLREGQVAAALGVSPRTLADWRTNGRGPAFVSINGRLVRYREADVEAWVGLQVRSEHVEKAAVDSGPGRVVAFPVYGGRARVQRVHRFGRHRTKSEGSGESCSA